MSSYKYRIRKTHSDGKVQFIAEWSVCGGNWSGCKITAWSCWLSGTGGEFLTPRDSRDEALIDIDNHKANNSPDEVEEIE